jgi:acetyl-CoA C-acetyltransferase/acetyl-CoA acyltransferase
VEEEESMVDVAVVGVGQTKYGAFPEKGMKELFVDAFREAVADVQKGIDPKRIQEAFIGTLETGGNQLGNVASLVIEQVHIPNIPARRVENACASSGFAFRDAYLAVKTGRYDVVLAGGVEKMTDLPRERNRYWLGVSGDVEWERLAGTNFPGIYAMIAMRHMYEYGTKKEQISGVAVKNHRNAAKNPKAQLRFEITLERAMTSQMLAYPLTIFDACPTTDGASVAILCRGELAKEFTDSPVYVVGSGAATDFLAIHDRKQITHLIAGTLAGKQAYEEAGVKPQDIDVAEVHDCFTIAEILAYESLGFAKIGEGGRLVSEGETEIGGKIPVNPSGGLKAKGHPIGATGVGQVYEITHQLRGDLKEKERQVKDAEIGLTHNVGGSGGTAVVHILKREA